MSAVFASGVRCNLDSLHQNLAVFNQRRLRPGLPTDDWNFRLHKDLKLQLMEGDYIESELQEVRTELSEIPRDADAFIAWFESLHDIGPGQNDPLFSWLADTANLEDMRWFLRQEVAGEAGFDDLVALTQLRLPNRAKLELARNYWDEMGRGHERGMHGPMLTRVSTELNLEPQVHSTVWESLALANLMVGLAVNRRYAYHAIGALGVIEMTAPARVSHTNAGLKRLGVPASARRYFQLHAGLDIQHSEAWNREVIRPLVAANPELARPIAEGAWMRLQSGARCFARYRRELGVSENPRAARTHS